MKLLNIIRIFLYLKIQETWKGFLITLGIISAIFLIIWAFIFYTNITTAIFVILGILWCIFLIFSMIFIIIKEHLIPFIQSNWEKAKIIAEEESKK